jgi:copper transport protein
VPSAVLKRLWGLARILSLAALAILLHAQAALAHASLIKSEPTDGALVQSAPASYSLTFSEPVSPLALKLTRPDGSSIALDRFALKDRIVEIEAPSGLGRGTHVLTWRVVSEDGHPVGGSLVFSIGEASPEAPLVDEEPDWTVRGGLWLTKIALYVGLFIGVGGAFGRRVLMPTVRTATIPITVALLLGVAGAILSIGFQGLDALEAQVGRIWEPVIWSTGFGTSYGRTVAAAITACVLAGIALIIKGRPSKLTSIMALLLAGIALALSGHASAADPQWLMRPAVFLHTATIAIWIGALLPLGLALKSREAGAVPALQRFSYAIPVIVAILILGGCVLAYVQIERPSALLDTAYGQIMLVKLALLVRLFLLAAVNRWTLTVPAVAGDQLAIRRLTRSIAVETTIALLIFGTVATLRFTPPPRVIAAAAAEPASEFIQTDKALAMIQLRPGHVGPVDVAVNVLTGDFQLLDAKEVTLVMSNPKAGTDPFKLKLTRHGDANWRAESLTIPIAGLWRVRVDIRVSDSDVVKLEGQMRVRQ